LPIIPTVDQKPISQEIMEDLLERLKKMVMGGAGHGTMVDEVKKSGHNGYEISEDETLIVAHFGDQSLLVAPYCSIHTFKK